MTKVSIIAAAFVLSANSAFAISKDLTPVPEIDALSGVAVVAALGGLIALMRERSK